MKRFVWIAAAVVGLLVAVALIVPFLVPNDVYRSRIETAASDALGREVTLTGDVGLSLFPSISAKIEGVSVANPEGFSRDNMIEAGALRGVVKWGPLLARRVEIAEIVFEDADVQLERRADGQANWEFGAAEPSEPAPEDEGVGGAVDAGIDTASLRNARLAFIDATSGASYEIAELNLTAQMRAMDTPLQLDADGLFQGQDFELDLTLATLDALLGGAAADVEATIGVAGGDARYDGALTLSDELQLDGAYSVSARALQNLAELAGIDLGYNLAVLGNVRAEGRLAGPLSALKINFERATIDGDGLGASYTGDVTLGDSVTLGGSFSAESRDLPAWLGDFGIQLPEAANVLENVSVSANLTGALDTLKVSGIELRQVGPLLNAEYLGDVSLGGDGRFQGEVETSSGALRSLLDTVGVEMAPGDTLQSFDVNGAVSGTFSRFSVSGLTAEL
ncbi:MAG: AsmA family protein, partial [Pseudomonadota bacterium]